MDTLVFPLHAGARSSLKIAAVLLILLVFTAPLGIWILVRVSRGDLTIGASEARAISEGGTGQVVVPLGEVARLGIARVPMGSGGGIGGALARRKVGGSEAVILCFILRGGKRRMLCASMFEGYERAIEAIAARMGREVEPFEVGIWGVKWPK